MQIFIFVPSVILLILIGSVLIYPCFSQEIVRTTFTDLDINYGIELIDNSTNLNSTPFSPMFSNIYSFFKKDRGISAPTHVLDKIFSNFTLTILNRSLSNDTTPQPFESGSKPEIKFVLKPRDQVNNEIPVVLEDNGQVNMAYLLSNITKFYPDIITSQKVKL